MSATAVLSSMRERLTAALPAGVTVSVHLKDLSDAQTGKWLLRLPGVYLVAEGIDARYGGDATLKLRVYVLARLADQSAEPALIGWALAEAVLAGITSDVAVAQASLVYRDEAGLDQPGIGLWEIAVTRRHVVGGALDALADGVRAEQFWASWAPWIGAAHEDKYVRIDTEPQVGERTIEELLP